MSAEAAPSYDAIWSDGWEDMRALGPMARHTRRLMLNMTADLKPGSILDVGCGEGSLLLALAKAHPGAALGGVEISNTAAGLARKRLPTAKIVVTDISSEALAERYDLVVCADVVEHIVEDVAALRNIAAMIAPGGHAVIATLQGRMRRFEAAIGHVRNYAAGELRQKMEAAGLTIDREIAWGWPLYSPLYRDFLDAIGNRGTMGRFGPGRKLVSHLLYAVFRLNSSRRGDYIFLRGRKG